MSEAKTGFTRGFFGCFGVLAAVVLVVVAFLSLGQCSPREVTEPSPATAITDYNRLYYAAHCVNGLAQAQAQGKANPNRSALATPMDISGATSADGRDRLVCSVMTDGKPAVAVVEIVCTNEDDEKCSRLLSFDLTGSPPGA